MSNSITGIDSLAAFSSRPELLQVVSDAVAGGISQFARVEAKLEGAAALSPESRKCDVAGLINLKGSGMEWTLWLAFSKETFLNFSRSAFAALPDDPREISLENRDLAGELLNVAFGYLDPQLRGIGLKFQSSVPSTFTGSELAAILPRLPKRSIHLPGSSSGGKFTFEIFDQREFPVKG